MSIVVVGNGTPESIFNIESFVDNTKSITFRQVTEPKTFAKIKELTLELLPRPVAARVWPNLTNEMTTILMNS